MSHRTFLVQKIHLVRVTVPAGCQEAVAGLLENPFKSVHLELQLRPLKHTARPVDAHMAVGPQLVLRGLIAQPISANHRIAASQLGLPLQHHDGVSLTSEQVAKKKSGQLTAQRWGQLLLQERTAFEPWRQRWRDFRRKTLRLHPREFTLAQPTHQQGQWSQSEVGAGSPQVQFKRQQMHRAEGKERTFNSSVEDTAPSRKGSGL